MSVLGAALLVVLGASTSPHPADLQVEAVTAAGVELPELAEAVARVLVAGGARVLLGGPGSRPCDHCARVEVVETGPGAYRVDVSNRDHASSTNLRLPAGSPLFDRAHAIAIQTRMLTSWAPAPEAKTATARPSRKPAARAIVEARQPPEARPVPAAAEPSHSRPWIYEPLPDSTLAQLPAAAPAAVERPVATPTPAYPARREATATSPASEARAVDPVAARPADRTSARPASRTRASARPTPAEAAARPTVDLAAGPGESPGRRWPWVPTAAGAGAAVAAAICAVVARDRYNGLENKNQSYANAQALKSQGENWQLASLVLAGVAVVGVGTGIVGFATGSSGSPSVTAVVSPVPGGGMIAFAGDLP